MAPRNKRKAARPQDPSIPKRARNHRTKQDPWEKSREDDEALEAEAILRAEYRRGLPFYEVHWKGYSSETTETTLEPAENPRNVLFGLQRTKGGHKVDGLLRALTVKVERCTEELSAQEQSWQCAVWSAGDGEQ